MIRFVLFVFLFFCVVPTTQAQTLTVLASWYGPGFEGKRMANSQQFRSDDSSIAANRTLPLGTRLRVINPANGRKLVVVVKDRGPYVKGRDLDLSFAAARYLGYIEDGVAKLIITICD